MCKHRSVQRSVWLYDMIALNLHQKEHNFFILHSKMRRFKSSWCKGLSSDEPELEFSSSSWAELWRFRAEPSWGTSIFELKLSGNRADNISKNSKFLTYLSQVFQELQLFWIIECKVTKLFSWHVDKLLKICLCHPTLVKFSPFFPLPP